MILRTTLKCLEDDGSHLSKLWCYIPFGEGGGEARGLYVKMAGTVIGGRSAEEPSKCCREGGSGSGRIAGTTTTTLRSTRRCYPHNTCLLYTSPSPRDRTRSRMPSSA
eukprot:TRINITY_DN34069_c0_g3_i1.p2 TRINITY_DN34069_c0_g3~~TRINITY_DN34069_c0_g3_i1.p2  ORF type:complete len:108 (+),score=11.07 TRINITY_DN34069_c0_g3_i1:766-1089(+)